MLLKPVRKLIPNLIIDEWENIQRIMVSLALKRTTQHINFYGCYEFSTGPEAINLEEIIQELAQVPVAPALADSCAIVEGCVQGSG